jgi:hypothetical protein
MDLKKLISLFLIFSVLDSCKVEKVQLTHEIDESAGGVTSYVITTPSAIYYLEKEGGGLSSIIDKDGVDWIGFHNKEGSGHKGKYRGFPNAIHKQDGSYFHAMNVGTNPSNSVVNIESKNHVRITFTSGNKQWQGQWDFYPGHCDFKMIKISSGYKYWVQYEGVPGGEMDITDFWYASVDTKQHPIEEAFTGDLPAPEWMAFGDQNSPRVLYLLHHKDDEFPDNYVSRPYMTVLGFGRQNGEKTTKYLTTTQTFSIGFVESKEYLEVEKAVRQIIE